MIFDNAKNAALYSGCLDNFEYALDLALSLAGDEVPMGKYEGEGGVYVVKSTYETKVCEGKATYEAHREYIDLQILVSGKEKILVADLDACAVTRPYEPDYLLGEIKDGEREQVLTLGEKDFAVLYPTDAHAPGLAAEKSEKVVKLVAKIPVKA